MAVDILVFSPQVPVLPERMVHVHAPSDLWKAIDVTEADFEPYNWGMHTNLVRETCEQGTHPHYSRIYAGNMPPHIFADLEVASKLIAYVRVTIFDPEQYPHLHTHTDLKPVSVLEYPIERRTPFVPIVVNGALFAAFAHRTPEVEIK